MKLREDLLAGIVKRVPIDDRLQVVLVDVGGRKELPPHEYNCNVYCLDRFNEVVWQVSSGDPRHANDSFVAIDLDGAWLNAERFFGGEYRINVSTGVAVEVGWHK